MADWMDVPPKDVLGTPFRTRNLTALEEARNVPAPGLSMKVEMPNGKRGVVVGRSRDEYGWHIAAVRDEGGDMHIVRGYDLAIVLRVKPQARTCSNCGKEQP